MPRVLDLAHPILGFFSVQSGGSPNADEIASLYNIILVIAVIIFIAVEGGLIYALVKFRKKKGAIPEQIHGNTRLEAGWTIAAALILVALAVVTFIKLPAIQDPPNGSGSLSPSLTSFGEPSASDERHLPPDGKALKIVVVGRQYLWQYLYPIGETEPHNGLGRPYAYEEMVVPTETTISLDVVSADVVHAWWVPALGGKVQAVPGYHSYTWFKISHPGVFHGQCAFLCGRLHARMIATVRAVPPAQFEAWLAKKHKELTEAKLIAGEETQKLKSQTGANQVLNP
jgi:cytochrome c oxidase subunit 2